MRRVMICLLLAVVLSLSLTAPVLADKGGNPNGNADWGQAVADSTPLGEHASMGAGVCNPGNDPAGRFILLFRLHELLILYTQ